MDDDYPILTPEKIVVSFPVCSVGSRIAAHILDLIIVGAGIVGISMLVSFLAGLTFGSEAAATLSLFAAFITGFGYFVLMEWLWSGQTLGKRAAGIRVVMQDGTPVTFLAAFYRNIVRFGDILPGFYAVGMICIFTNKEAQRLGDLVAGTVVIRTIRPVRAFTPAPHRYGLHPFEEQIGSLDRMSMEEYFAIKRLCDRFPELPPETQQKSIQTVWAPFAQAHHIAPIVNVHPVYQMEAVVMKYGREHKLV